jgi:hypothetical protein
LISRIPIQYHQRTTEIDSRTLDVSAEADGRRAQVKDRCSSRHVGTDVTTSQTLDIVKQSRRPSQAHIAAPVKSVMSVD